MHARRRMSQIFRLVSTEPEAKNSPYGCHCTATQFERCPVSVRATRPCSRSHILSVPPAEPAMTVRSDESNETHSTAEVWPDRLIIAFGLPIDQRLTFLSSPPVTITLPDCRPTCTQLTGPAWATNSSADGKGITAGLYEPAGAMRHAGLAGRKQAGGPRRAAFAGYGGLFWDSVRGERCARGRARQEWSAEWRGGLRHSRHLTALLRLMASAAWLRGGEARGGEERWEET
eukprot:scaffold111170_cov30-Tisochrysis_lutea.AAC.1